MPIVKAAKLTIELFSFSASTTAAPRTLRKPSASTESFLKPPESPSSLNVMDMVLFWAQAESTVHMLNWAIRSVKFLGVEFDQSEDEEIAVSDTTHL